MECEWCNKYRQVVTAVLSVLLLLSISWSNTMAALMADSDDLASQVTRYFEWVEDNFPSYALKMGRGESTSTRLGSVDPAEFQGWVDSASNIYHSIDNIRDDSLSEGDKFIKRMLASHLDTFIQGYGYAKYGAYNALNSMEGPQTYAHEWVKHANFSTQLDYDNYMDKLSKIPSYLDGAKKGMDESIKEKTTNHKSSLMGLEDQINDIASNFGNSAFVVPISEITSNLRNSQSTSSDLQAMGMMYMNDLIQNVINPLITLKSSYLPKYKENVREEMSVVTLPGGLDYYKSSLRWYLHSQEDENVLHSKGEEEVRRIYREIDELLKRSDGGMERVDSMRQQRDMYLELKSENPSSRNDMINKFRELYGKIKEKMTDGKVFKVDNLKDPLWEAHPVMGLSDHPLLDYWPSLSTIFINTNNAKQKPLYEYLSVLLHEGAPGRHYLQTIVSDKSPDFLHYADNERRAAVPFKLPTYSAFTEGWSLYAVQAGEDLDLYTDDKQRFGKLTTQLLPAVRLVLDMGIHVKRWSKEEAFSYLRNYTVLNERDMEREVVRTVTWPGQGAAQKYGEMKIMELREKCHKSLGSYFKLRDFHSAVLSRGVVTLPLLEEQVNGWLEEEIATIPPGKREERVRSTSSSSSSSSSLLILSLSYLLTSVLVRT